MRARVTLRSPFGPVVTRDITGGMWVDPAGDSDVHLGRESWALPGLCDAHAHLSGEKIIDPGDIEGAMRRARDALSAGVTLLLDKGWRDTTAIEAVGRVPAFDRPDVEAAGAIISVPDGYFPDFGRKIDPHQIGLVAEEEARRGLGWVKLVGDWPRRGIGPMPNFEEGQLVEAVSAAEAVGARVAIHTMAREVPGLAVRAGVHSIEHGLFLTEGDVEILGSRSGMWVPTVLRVEETIRELGGTSSGGKLLLEGLENTSRLLPYALEAGVRVLAGSDLVGAPADISKEAIRLADLGLSARQAVEAVGSAAFDATGRSTGFEPGSPANAVLFPENPITTIEVLATPSAVIRLGMIR